VFKTHTEKMAGTEGLILIFGNVYRSYKSDLGFVFVLFDWSDLGFVFVLFDCLGQEKLHKRRIDAQATDTLKWGVHMGDAGILM